MSKEEPMFSKFRRRAKEETQQDWENRLRLKHLHKQMSIEDIIKEIRQLLQKSIEDYAKEVIPAINEVWRKGMEREKEKWDKNCFEYLIPKEREETLRSVLPKEKGKTGFAKIEFGDNITTEIPIESNYDAGWNDSRQESINNALKLGIKL